jgi:hypothetical protein
MRQFVWNPHGTGRLFCLFFAGFEPWASWLTSIDIHPEYGGVPADLKSGAMGCYHAGIGEDFPIVHCQPLSIMPARKKAATKDSTANLGFEAKLWLAADMGMAEEQGFGLTSLKQQAEKLGLPLPSYSMEGDSLVLTIYRSKAAAATVLGKEVLASLSKSERAGWEWLATKETTSSTEYAVAMAVPNRTALNHLKRLTDLKLLAKTGSGPTTQYRVVRQ